MTCPYCAETIHASAKFCPKCGLPLKEDATVLGIPVDITENPNRSAMIAGGVAIVAVAIAIGWLSTGQGSAGQKGEIVRREAVLPPSAVIPVTAQMPAPAFQSSVTPVQAWAKPATSNVDILTLEKQRNTPPPQEYVPPPPSHVLAMNPFTRPESGYVIDASPVGPIAPSLPLVAVQLPEASARHLRSFAYGTPGAEGHSVNPGMATFGPLRNADGSLAQNPAPGTAGGGPTVYVYPGY